MSNEPNQIREKILESLNSPIIKCLDSKGITLDKLAGKLADELEANTTKQFQYEGNVVTAPDVIAWEIRQRARQDAHKLRGDYPAERHEISGQLTDPRTPEEREVLMKVARRLVEELRQKEK